MIVHAYSPEHRSVRLSVCMYMNVGQHYNMGNFHRNLIDKAIIYWRLFIGGNYAQFITRSSEVTVDRIQKCLIQNLLQL